MACVRGCCETQAEHYRSLMVAASDRRRLTKTTTDEHDKHTVDVTEHWHERQDVKVNVQEPIRIKAEELRSGQ